jgi:hypothetical protein
MEIFARLGLALVLSLGLAVLLAWGWDSSEPLPTTQPKLMAVSDNSSSQ